MGSALAFNFSFQSGDAAREPVQVQSVIKSNIILKSSVSLLGAASAGQSTVDQKTNK